MGKEDISKPRGINRRPAIILGVVILGAVFALPVFPMTYYIPYFEEVPTLKVIDQTNVVTNLRDIPLEEGETTSSGTFKTRKIMWWIFL